MPCAPLPPDEEHQLYTEGIDYAATPDASIWGVEDALTVHALRTEDIHGRWLNLCAGDGRFNTKLLDKADRVVATDADPGALEKLVRLTPRRYRPKLETITSNVTEPFPFPAASFDGIFCTATLHLFPKQTFMKIVAEMERILRPSGFLIIDFATDIRRIRTDGSLYTVVGEPLYTVEEALAFLKECFAGFETKFQTAKVEPAEVHVRGETYTFASNYILLIARKNGTAESFN